jgi:hypothetical protein
LDVVDVNDICQVDASGELDSLFGHHGDNEVYIMKICLILHCDGREIIAIISKNGLEGIFENITLGHHKIINPLYVHVAHFKHFDILPVPF